MVDDQLSSTQINISVLLPRSVVCFYSSPSALLCSPSSFTMTIATIDPKPKDSKTPRLKPAPRSDEQRAAEKADRLAKKVKLNEQIVQANEAIDKIIGQVSEDSGQPFDYIANLVHLGGRVYKNRRKPTIHNAISFASARVEDGRCKSFIVSVARNFLLASQGRSAVVRLLT